MSDNAELDQIRAATEAVLEQARNDEAARAALLADPVGTLAAGGVPADVAEYIGTHELGVADEDASGFMRTSGCDTITCCITACSNMPWTGHTGCGQLTLKD